MSTKYQLQFLGLEKTDSETVKSFTDLITEVFGLSREEAAKFIDSAPIVFYESENKEELTPLMESLGALSAKLEIIEQSDPSATDTPAEDPAATDDLSKTELDLDLNLDDLSQPSNADNKELRLETEALELKLESEALENTQSVLDEIDKSLELDLNETSLEMENPLAKSDDDIFKSVDQPEKEPEKEPEVKADATPEPTQEQPAGPVVEQPAAEPPAAETPAAEAPAVEPPAPETTTEAAAEENEATSEEASDQAEVPASEESEEASEETDDAPDAAKEVKSAKIETTSFPSEESDFDPSSEAPRQYLDAEQQENLRLEALRKKTFGLEYIIPIIVGAFIIFEASLFLFPVAEFEEEEALRSRSSSSATHYEKPEVVYLKYNGFSEQEGIKTKISVTAVEDLLQTAIVEIAPPPPPRSLTPEDLILNKAIRPWIEEIRVEPIKLSRAPDQHSFLGISKARIYINENLEKSRIVVPVAVRAIVDSEQNILKFGAILKHGFKETPEDLVYVLENTPAGGKKLFMKLVVEAKPEIAHGGGDASTLKEGDDQTEGTIDDERSLEEQIIASNPIEDSMEETAEVVIEEPEVTEASVEEVTESEVVEETAEASIPKIETASEEQVVEEVAVEATEEITEEITEESEQAAALVPEVEPEPIIAEAVVNTEQEPVIEEVETSEPIEVESEEVVAETINTETTADIVESSKPSEFVEVEGEIKEEVEVIEPAIEPAQTEAVSEQSELETQEQS